MINEYRTSKENAFSFGVPCWVFDIRHSRDSSNPRAGSALILVLGLTVLLSFLILGFGRMLRSDLKAASAFYDEAVNTQSARSAHTLAMREMGRASGMPYADQFGSLYFVANPESYEDEIEILSVYREGYSFGRGMLSYQFVQKPFALDLNELNLAQWDRLFEIACGLEDEDERAVLADRILDWTDSDSNARENGFEEEDYQALEPPRHCRNDGFGTVEELLLVYGMTEELFYGYGIPVREEDGLLYGGGLCRYLIGDNSPEAEATVQYVMRGVLPTENPVEEEEDDSEVFERVKDLPAIMYLVAQGFVPESPADETDLLADPFEDPEAPASIPEVVSRHMMLIVFELPEDGKSPADYVVTDFQENAAGSLLDAVLAYGVPEEE
jgi:hypothetical protein